MTHPSRGTAAGNAYLDLQKKARTDRRPVDELLQLYVLEGFLARLAQSSWAGVFVLKGGVLMAALGERRATRDIDLQAEALDNDAEVVRSAICEVAAIELEDGVVFAVSTSSVNVIRDEDAYTGVRVTMQAELATARPHFHVDVNVGDPIVPGPEDVHVPRVLGGEVVVRGYPLSMVYAEKIVTAIVRGTANTRWRDFGDVYLLSRRHPIAGTALERAIRDVAAHRQAELTALAIVLEGYPAIAQQRWAVWRRKQQLEDRLPEQFADALSAVVLFADPVITGAAGGRSWNPGTGSW